MADTGTPPVIPIEFQQYKSVTFALHLLLISPFQIKQLNFFRSSYVVDPQWQRKFSIIWPSVLAGFVLLSLPHLVRSIKTGRAYSTFFGISEDLSGDQYSALALTADKPMKGRSSTSIFAKFEKVFGLLGSLFYWTLPGFALNAGQSRLFVKTHPSGYLIMAYHVCSCHRHSLYSDSGAMYCP